MPLPSEFEVVRARSRTPRVVALSAGALLLLGLALLGLGLAAVPQALDPHGEFQILPDELALRAALPAVLIGACAMSGALGLLRRQAWAWWVAVSAAAALAILNGMFLALAVVHDGLAMAALATAALLVPPAGVALAALATNRARAWASR